MKRAVTGVGSLVGLVLVICAVMGAVLLGTQGTWHSELHVPAGRTAIVVEPALASVIGPTISVHARTADPNVPLFIGRARPDDAAALVQTTDRLRVTGLSGARLLATDDAPGSGTLPALDGVDVWHSRTVRDGDARLSYRAERGAQSAVIARADGRPLPAVALTLSWTNRTWYWIPLLLLVAGLGLIAGLRRWNRPATARSRTWSVGRGGSLARARRIGRPARPGKTAHVGRRRAASGSRRGR